MIRAGFLWRARTTTFLSEWSDKVATSRLMLEAHEYLCRADERNEEKFRDVKQFLREEVARKAGSPPTET
jgi:hypothetical protein